MLALPGDQRSLITRELDAICRGVKPMTLTVAGLRSLGRGTAFFLEAPRLRELRDSLADEWQGWLTPQDSQRYHPHVTIQNKVDPKEAKALLAALSAGFQPFEVRGEGLLLWRYLGGPWERLRSFRFTG